MALPDDNKAIINCNTGVSIEAVLFENMMKHLIAQSI